MNADLNNRGFSILKEIGDKDHGVFVIEDRDDGVYIAKYFQDQVKYQKEFDIRKRMSNHTSRKLFPDIVDFDATRLLIIFEKMQPVGDYFCPDMLEIPREKIDDVFIQTLDNKIGLMHQAGIAHGQLHGGNVVVDSNYEPFIISLGYAFDINDHSWDTEIFMRRDFDWAESYESFVNHDYYNWRMVLGLGFIPSENGILPSHNDIPRDKIPNSEEYYVVRFRLREHDELHLSDFQFANVLQNIIGGEILKVCYDAGNRNRNYYVNSLPRGQYADITGIYPNREMFLKANKQLFKHQHGLLKETLIPSINIIPGDAEFTEKNHGSSLYQRVNEVAVAVLNYLQMH